MTAAAAARATGDVFAEVRGVTKRFGGIVALDGVDLALRGGEVHCLIGENGAGKSTVVKLLAGAQQPDTGTVDVGGRQPHNPADALRAGVNTVYQELTLVPEMTVAGNVMLGHEPTRRIPGLLARREKTRIVAALLDDLGIALNPTARVATLGIAQQQLVEIAKAVARGGGRVLILDEPTAPLTQSEAATLFELVRRLRQKGLAQLYITHRLDEVELIGDVVTVMRDGAVVSRGGVEAMGVDKMVEHMVGRRVEALYPAHRRTPGDVALEVSDQAAGSIMVRRGEVVGLFGLIGAGRTELVRRVYGADPRPTTEVRVNGVARQLRSPRDATRNGIALVPEDRKGQGIVPELSVATNVSIGVLPNLSSHGWLPPRQIAAHAESWIDRLSIRASSPKQLISLLSGGNQQKCAIARALASEPAVVVLDEPTRGIDVNARVEIYQLLNDLCAAGLAVLMVSSDLLEVLATTDRVVVMREGRIVGELVSDGATEQDAMRLAVGAPTTQNSTDTKESRAR